MRSRRRGTGRSHSQLTHAIGSSTTIAARKRLCSWWATIRASDQYAAMSAESATYPPCVIGITHASM
ncbi:MAG: hypothetical protein R3C45_06175 [Phycisphaerales bacterium]